MGFLAFSIKMNGYFVILLFFYIWILKQKIGLRKSKQTANLAEKKIEIVKTKFLKPSDEQMI